MSTILKSAAMTLLSKTLQTFLSKYLSDVDVEGVALPSVYDGSGWGVRLSNVKLRDGVELLKKMPGKAVKKRKRNVPRTKSKRRGRRQKSSSVLETPAVRKALPDGGPAKQDPARIEGDEIEKQLDQEDQDHTTIGDPEKLQRGVEDVPQPLQEADRKGNKKTFRASLARSFDEEDVTVATDASRPTTPVQDSKSFFSCFHRSTSTKHDGTTTQNRSQVSLHGQNGSKNPNTDESSSTLQVAALDSKFEQVVSEPLGSTDEVQRATDGDDENRDDTSDADDDEEEEEFEEYEQPMKLCLGENGSIGTLDIRLIGKELHVMVEDAVLTIEAIPIVETDQGEGDDTATKDDGPATNDSTPPEKTGSPQSNPPKPTEKEKPKKPRKTVGDRVLADNPLARALSAIPHLFLRDIRIRLIIRDEPPAPIPEDEKETSPEGFPEPGPRDSMLQFGIEFLSVASDDDILSHFRNDPDDEPQESAGLTEDSVHRPLMKSASSFATTESASMDKNEFLVRHIRTGRGPMAGITVQVFCPGPKLPQKLLSNDTDYSWARQQWVLASDFYLLRCSGLDVQARIHLGTKKEVDNSSWFYDYEDIPEYDESTLDSLLFGLDTVAPGPQLPLPYPITAQPPMSRGNISQTKSGESYDSLVDEENNDEYADMPALHPGVDVYYKDKNGIQSCMVPSSFHRISRGMLPGTCKDCIHLPSEVCSHCWEAPAGVSQDTELDNSMPMPGLVFQVSLRDPLEVNVDRAAVDTLGLLHAIFVKKAEPASSDLRPTRDADPESNTEATQPTQELDSSGDNATQATGASSSLFAGFLGGTKKEDEPAPEDPSEAFAVSMQPENIQILGVYLSDIVFRVHLMRPDRSDRGLSFSYWDVGVNCLTVDYHSQQSPELCTNDLKFDIGHLTIDEYRGTSSKRVVSLGMPVPSRRRCNSGGSVTTMQSMIEDHEFHRTPWPSTACALLGIPPPLESMVSKGRERHAVQIRFVAVNNPTKPKESARSMVNMRLGLGAIILPWGFWQELIASQGEIVSGILGKSKSPKSSSPVTAKKEISRPRSLMTYTIQVDGGQVKIHPVIKMNLPLTCFSGERSSETGILFETILDKLRFAYGQHEPHHKKMLSLSQLASLPESIRMRILLCLSDLKPLEDALHVKSGPNLFKRTRAVNKGILKMAKRVSRSSRAATKRRSANASEPSGTAPRRQEIITEMMKMDENELDELWSMHQKHKRKLAKKRNNSLMLGIPPT